MVVCKFELNLSIAGRNADQWHTAWCTTWKLYAGKMILDLTGQMERENSGESELARKSYVDFFLIWPLHDGCIMYEFSYRISLWITLYHLALTVESEIVFIFILEVICSVVEAIFIFCWDQVFEVHRVYSCLCKMLKIEVITRFVLRFSWYFC